MTNYRRISAIVDARAMRLPLVCALVLTVAATVSRAAQTIDSAPSGRLVFVVRPLGKYGPDYNRSEIYTVRTDGTGLRRLAKNATDPTVSPDGEQVAFARKDNIWLMSTDGQSQRRLTSAGSNHSPAWSADGATLFFLRRGARTDQILRMRTDGSVVRRLLRDTCLFDLATSPNGRELAFTHWPSESSVNECDGWPPKISSSNIDGRNVRFLTSSVWSEDPAWSPDGTLLAFSSADGIDGEPWGVYVQSAKGLRRLTTRSGSPSWSTDGSQIAFADGDLWVIRTDGKGLRSVRKTKKLDESDGVWMPGPDG
jgi:Tol biopolymer transport system component